MLRVSVQSKSTGEYEGEVRAGNRVSSSLPRDNRWMKSASGAPVLSTVQVVRVRLLP